MDIVFNSLPLDVHQRVFNSDFVREIQTHYFIDELDENFINTVEVLEFDYDLSTLEDLFYFPNLKKVVLGKNRYLYEAYKDAVKQSVLADTAVGLPWKRFMNCKEWKWRDITSIISRIHCLC